jgi:hypothetical protein
MYVEVVTKLLEAEDLVVAKDYRAARTIVDAILTKYPLADQGSWWGGIYWAGQGKATKPHLGEPGAYAHLRMLDDITKIGVTKPLAGSKPITLAVLLPSCSDIVPNSGPTQMNHRLSPEIEVNNYEPIHQSLRLFQSYVLAISGGELRLEVKIHKIDECFQINKGNAVDNYTSPVAHLPAGVADASDMFWLIYPLDINAGQNVGQGGGMGGYGSKPYFISEDDWVIKKRTDQGSGERTEVERRMYLPEWVQHEFFHHLFSRWPAMELEKADHQWFNKANWPADFRGDLEEDYYSEALNKRLYQAKPSIAQMLKQSP